MCHYIQNVIIKLLYNDSKMIISISSHIKNFTCRELISTNIIHLSNIKTLIIFFLNILDI
jgi:hypothetical protein